MTAPTLPDGWEICARETPDGEHWSGQFHGPHGVTARLGDATREGLVAKIVAREKYRVAAGLSDPSPVALRSTP